MKIKKKALLALAVAAAMTMGTTAVSAAGEITDPAAAGMDTVSGMNIAADMDETRLNANADDQDPGKLLIRRSTTKEGDSGASDSYLYEYDSMNHLIKQTCYSDGYNVITYYEYDESKGYMTLETTGIEKAGVFEETYKYVYQYDEMDRLIKRTGTHSGEVREIIFAYDSGRLARKTGWVTKDGVEKEYFYSVLTYDSTGLICTEKIHAVSDSGEESLISIIITEKNAKKTVIHTTITYSGGNDYEETVTKLDSTGEYPLEAEKRVTATDGTVTVSDESFAYAPEPIRSAGKTRYDTASVIALNNYPQGSTGIVLVSGENFPDALSAAGYAGKMNLPVLITTPDKLQEKTKLLIEEWKVTDVMIIGGMTEVTEQVEKDLVGCGIDQNHIQRLKGDTRSETAAAVEAAAEFDKSGACVLASGKSPSDALSISPWCRSKAMPLLLAENDGSVSEKTFAALKKYAKVYICGGSLAVSDSVMDSLEKAGVKTFRLDGKDRYEISIKIADTFSQGSADSGNLFLASGDDGHYADALIGSMKASDESAPILLISSDSESIFKYIRDRYTKSETMNHLHVLGGYASVGDTTMNKVLQLW